MLFLKKMKNVKELIQFGYYKKENSKRERKRESGKQTANKPVYISSELFFEFLIFNHIRDFFFRFLKNGE